MSLWEYKIISSGKGGFATPAMLEKFLNDLGRDEWEIIDFRSPPENALAFTGLARRSTQRDWTLEDAAAAAAKAEAEKLRAEFSAKFEAATSNVALAEEKSASFLEEKAAPDGGFRKPVDTSRDSDPDAHDEETPEKDEWDELASEDELPSFFDALKPHMRRNQRGPGMSVGTDYLAKKWGLAEEDIKGALVECGMQIPGDEDARPAYVEYDGDLFWVNINRRGEVWINTREKPRPVFRVVQATKVAPEAIEESKSEPPPKRVQDGGERGERTEQRKQEVSEKQKGSEPAKPQPKVFQPSGAKKEEAQAQAPAAALPGGPGLLEKIRPMMRQNRRGPGGSGSGSFLARALKCAEADLLAAFEALGLKIPATAADEPVEVEISGDIWWVNKDSRGGVWINGREKREGDVPKPASAQPTAAPASEGTDSAASLVSTGLPAGESSPSSEPPELLPTLPIQSVAADPATVPSTADNVFAAVRLLLQPTKTGSFAGKVDRVASELTKSPDDLVTALVAAGLKVPEKPREKPLFVEHAGEIFWLNKNAKGELWVNAKASKYADKASGDDSGDASNSGDDAKKSSRRPPRPKKSAEQPTEQASE
ncbi:MAG: hypothetical protein ABIV50_03145, partial [Opitutus sp.]